MTEPSVDGNPVLIDFVRSAEILGAGYLRTNGSLCDGLA
jgi:hypothetical protein